MESRYFATSFTKARQLVAVILVGLTVAACVSQPTEQQIATADYGPRPPENHQQMIKDWFRTRLIDPTSPLYNFEAPRRGYTNAVPLRDVPMQFGWTVCGSINAKNRLGGYVGWETLFTLFKNGKLVYADSGIFAEEACKRA